ncbi:autotransporter-associated beta strand repeat-containing protein [Mesorhizobium sp. ES1-4]|uniref:autotransporter-associated beta strand repeat-containing protein n=1 Tax=Mesorhizobium sp. ES1-4 TaxID=2876627 RepID=UPI001CCDD124|nr:autotransporter-associated beta strand repeat-containing protein [Mesorhizobium sp. ES1-4]MBZ9798353.1 autotransporter-associated beta strand repeat-containing protein [Mesorhizobium sp. ES1-4]
MSGLDLTLGTLAFNLDNNYSFAGLVSGTGGLTKLGSGVTTLTGNNNYAGPTSVQAGTLIVNGNQSGATGLTTIAALGTLGGTGTIGGDVNVVGAISPGAAGNAPGTLTIKGALSLASSAALNYNFGQANVPGGALNDLIDVGGNLTLDGTLNITQTAGGTFGPGVYRVMNYNGTLTDNGLNVTDPNYFVQTSVANQVNLVNSAGLTLSYWDGNAGPHSNGIVNGGNGTWRAAGELGSATLWRFNFNVGYHASTADFANAIRSKLVNEIAGLSASVHPAAYQVHLGPVVDCDTVGEEPGR